MQEGGLGRERLIPSFDRKLALKILVGSNFALFFFLWAPVLLHANNEELCRR